MAKTDWTLTDTVKPDDFNDIGREINQLRTDVDHIEVPTASLTEAGIVQLSNAKDSTSESHAATSKALKDVYDLAQSSLTAGNERKSEVVAALVALGVSASTTDTWAVLISKMATVIQATGNATAADVLTGKTASNASGAITGTIPNRGAGGTVTPGTANQTKAAGYYSSPITVLGDPDLVAANIRSGVDIFGVVGEVEPSMQGTAPLNFSRQGQVSVTVPIFNFPVGVNFISFAATASSRFYHLSNAFMDLILSDGVSNIALVSTDRNQMPVTYFAYDGRCKYASFRHPASLSQIEARPVGLDQSKQWSLLFSVRIPSGSPESARQIYAQLVGNLYYS